MPAPVVQVLGVVQATEPMLTQVGEPQIWVGLQVLLGLQVSVARLQVAVAVQASVVQVLEP